jgi:hypothetical protein
MEIMSGDADYSSFESDGAIDYSSYDRAQLEDALSNIDRNQYPKNYEHLTRDLARRARQPRAPLLRHAALKNRRAAST